MAATCWYCEKCRGAGVCHHAWEADVYLVVHMVEEGHAQISPKCDQPAAKLRVSKFTYTLQDVPDWAAAKLRGLLADQL